MAAIVGAGVPACGLEAVAVGTVSTAAETAGASVLRLGHGLGYGSRRHIGLAGESIGMTR